MFLRFAAGRLQSHLRIFNNRQELSTVFSAEDMPDDSEVLRAGIAQTVFDKARRVPYLLTVNRGFFYAGMQVGNEWLLAGPLMSMIPIECSGDLQAELSPECIRDLNARIRPQPFSHCTEILCLLANVLCGEDGQPADPITPQRIETENRVRTQVDDKVLSEVTQSVFKNLEVDIRHNPYEEEIREMAAVERGDTELLRQILEESYVGNVGVLSDDALRHTKNLGIVIITIASRAAIRGGVHYEVAFSMSDQFIQEVERQTTVRDAEAAARAGEYQFAMTVRQYRESLRTMEQSGENAHVDRCKEYIFRHLHEKIRVSEIARQLALNSSYLSTIFKNSEGITITDYILRQKLVLVRNMLIYSDYSYLEITNYLGFASQSYLGKKFKEEVGMTLREFRMHYKATEFASSEGDAL